MRQYNIVLFVDGSSVRLAPAFDQVPTRYAPSADGQLPSRVLAVPYATSDTLDVWDEARRAAREFWEHAGDVTRLADGLRRCCAANARLLAT